MIWAKLEEQRKQEGAEAAATIRGLKEVQEQMQEQIDEAT
eukprot:gene27282-17213_t